MNRAIRTIRNVAVAALVMCLCEVAMGQIPPWAIGISPSNPQSADVVHINVITPIVCYPPSSPPWGVATSVSGQSIQILVTTPEPCLIGTPPPPWTFTTQVGPLPPGTYNVQTSVRGSSDGITFSVPQPTGVLSFVVVASTPIAPIPALNSLSAFALMALLAFLAARRIR
jgi:hypothetical protein